MLLHRSRCIDRAVQLKIDRQVLNSEIAALSEKEAARITFVKQKQVGFGAPSFTVSASKASSGAGVGVGMLGGNA